MELYERIESIGSRRDLAAFILELRDDLKAHTDEWENDTLESFLEALAACITDMDGYFQNRDEPVPEQPDWSLVGDLLYTAKLYE